MNQLGVFILLLLFFFHVKAQSPSEEEEIPSQNATIFQPSIKVVFGVLCVMFSLTFILLVFAKFCHGSSSVDNNQQTRDGLTGSRSRFSGIDKTVIDSLPFFRFSSLKGSREGLECAVCLSKFEDTEILRLLPKCKHAFHINCVDQWLEKHSSCPLCRYRVSANDLTLFAYSNSLRYLWDQSEQREDSNMELFVQREEDHHGSSSRFSIGSSFRKSEKGKKQEEEELAIQENCDSDDNQKALHKFNHRIIMSDVVLKNRWNSVSSSDLMHLNSEMLNAMSSNRFSSLDTNKDQFATASVVANTEILNIEEEMERKREFESRVSRINQSDSLLFSDLPNTSEPKMYTSRFLNPTEQRSKSEITVHPRFIELSMKNIIGDSSLPENNVKEERLRRLWLPIAKRTVQWFANREERTQESKNTRQSLNV